MNQSHKVLDLRRLASTCSQCRLQHLCLPRDLDPQDIAAIEAIVRRTRPLERASYLYRQGDRFRALYAVRAGSVKTLLATPDGLEQVTGFYLPGEIFGLDGFKDGRHACTAVALETSSVCELPEERIEELCGRVPGLLHSLLKLMAQEVNGEQAMLLLISQRTAQERVATFLVSISTRMSARGYSALEFNLSMSRTDIASYLGIEPETVSRQLAQLETQGLITADRRRVVVHNLGRLRDLAMPAGSCQTAQVS